MPVVYLVVDEPCEAAHGAALRRGLERGLARDAVLRVRELIAQCAHYLGEHHADVGLEAVLPFGIAL